MFSKEITGLTTYIARGYELHTGYWNDGCNEVMQAEVINGQSPHAGEIVAVSDVMPFDQAHLDLLYIWSRMVAHGHKITWSTFCLARTATK